MKKSILFFAMSLFVIAGAVAQSSITICGTRFNVECNDQEMTAKIVDYKYRIDDREFPVYATNRKIKYPKGDGVLEIPESIVVNGKMYYVTAIGRAAFAGFKNIKVVKLPAGVEKIEAYAFFRSSIEEIVIPASVEIVEERAFGHCGKLKDLVFESNDILLGSGLYDESRFVNVRYIESGNDMAQNSIKEERRKKSEKAKGQFVMGASDVDTDIPNASVRNEETFAIIIANEKYDTEANVEYAINDGEMFRNYCLRTLGIPEENIHFRKNATLNNIKGEIEWIEKVAQIYEGAAKFIIYYAGHGIPDENTKAAYLLPTDGSGTNTASGYSLDEMYSKLGRTKAKSVTVFLDACFSGAVRGDGMLASARGVAVKVKKNSVTTGNLVVFSAAQGDETAYPYNEKGHGMFTYFLLKKLQESKGEVTYGELGKYIKEQVSRRAIVINEKSQTPTVIPSSSMGENWKKMKLK